MNVPFPDDDQTATHPPSLDLERLPLSAPMTGREIVALMTALEFHSIVGRVPSPDAPWATATAQQEWSALELPDRANEPGNRRPRGYRLPDRYQPRPSWTRMIAVDTGRRARSPSIRRPAGPTRCAAELAGLSFAIDGGVAWYVPVGHETDGEQLPLEDVMASVRPLFSDDEPETLRSQRQLRSHPPQQLWRRSVQRHRSRHHDRRPPPGEHPEPSWA